MIWGTLALAFAAAFTGASFYVNWVEQPARLELDDQALLSEWGPSDSRGVALLAALALARGDRRLRRLFRDAGRALGVRRARHHRQLALRVFRHGAARQPDPVAARRRRRRGARARSPVGPCRIGPDGDRRSSPCVMFLLGWI